MDQSEHGNRWLRSERVNNGGPVGNSLAPEPTARTPSLTQVNLYFKSDLAPRSTVYIYNRRAREPTASLRLVSATCAQYGVG